MESRNRQPLIQLIDVAKEYPLGDRTVPVLAGIELRIERGCFASVMGPSGSGKTTLLNIVGCLERPSRGRYRLAGEDVSSLSDRALSKIRGEKVGFVFQMFHLLPDLTVLENVALALLYAPVDTAGHRELAARALERVGLQDRIAHRPAQLSGGEMQRAAIARALVKKPEVILADEPTGNLDTRTGEEILGLFGELHRDGATIVLVTHDPAVAARGMKRLYMCDGRFEPDRR